MKVDKRDVMVKHKNRDLMVMDVLVLAYNLMQYPSLFLAGNDWWLDNTEQLDSNKQVIIQEYYAYCMKV